MTILTGPIPSVPRSLKQRLAVFAGLLLICDFSTGMLVDWANAPARCEHASAPSPNNDFCPDPLVVTQTLKNAGEATLVQQQAEQNSAAVAQHIEELLWPDFGVSNETYSGLSAFWSDDTICNFFANIDQLAGQRVSRIHCKLASWVKVRHSCQRDCPLAKTTECQE